MADDLNFIAANRRRGMAATGSSRAYYFDMCWRRLELIRRRRGAFVGYGWQNI